MIPRLMCTQHPDATVKVTVNEEVDEALVSFIGYGCDEVMIDYEGKTTPYTQPKEVVMKAVRAEIKLGERFFVTPRMPNPRLEELERSLLTLEAAVSANYFSWKYLGTQAVRWVVLPMVSDFETYFLTRRILERKAKTIKEELGADVGEIELIPLFEDVLAQVKAPDLLRELFKRARESKQEIKEFRVFLGKSDAAVKYGHVASSLSMRRVLRELRRLGQEEDVKIYPMLGMGSPPFRGGINNPNLVNYEVAQYSGYTTSTIQSAVRYDVSYDVYLRVKDMILFGCCKEAEAVEVDPQLINKFSTAYKAFITPVLPKALELAKLVPSTRDRVSWTAYGREIGEGDRVINVPRAIVYTSMWYAAGLPPTLLDAKGIVEAYRDGTLDQVLKLLPALWREWEYDAQFYDPETAAKYLGEDVVKTVNEALDILDIQERASGIYKSLLRAPRTEANIIALGKYRRFLG